MASVPACANRLFFSLPSPETFVGESLRHVDPSGLRLATQGGKLQVSNFDLFVSSLTNFL